IPRARCPVIQPKRQSRTGSRGIAVQPRSRLKLRSRTNSSRIAHPRVLTSACGFAPGRDPSFLIAKPSIPKDALSCQRRRRALSALGTKLSSEFAEVGAVLKQVAQTQRLQRRRGPPRRRFLLPASV